ncbi:hypothetical protein OBBRIDRAFT_805598, partial [Obba rivulosa]
MAQFHPAATNRASRDGTAPHLYMPRPIVPMSLARIGVNQDSWQLYWQGGTRHQLPAASHMVFEQRDQYGSVAGFTVEIPASEQIRTFRDLSVPSTATAAPSTGTGSITVPSLYATRSGMYQTQAHGHMDHASHNHPGKAVPGTPFPPPEPWDSAKAINMAPSRASPQIFLDHSGYAGAQTETLTRTPADGTAAVTPHFSYGVRGSMHQTQTHGHMAPTGSLSLGPHVRPHCIGFTQSYDDYHTIRRLYPAATQYHLRTEKTKKRNDLSGVETQRLSYPSSEGLHYNAGTRSAPVQIGGQAQSVTSHDIAPRPLPTVRYVQLIEGTRAEYDVATTHRTPRAQRIETNGAGPYTLAEHRRSYSTTKQVAPYNPLADRTKKPKGESKSSSTTSRKKWGEKCLRCAERNSQCKGYWEEEKQPGERCR